MIEKKLPGAKNGVVNSFLEILPTLKDYYKKHKPFKTCTKCGDPSPNDTCNACKLEEELIAK
jgi:hypothetical protein